MTHRPTTPLAVLLLATAGVLMIGTPFTDGFGLDAPTPGCGLRQLLLFGLGILAAASALRLGTIPATTPRLWALLRIGAWFGLATGLASVVQQTLRQHSWGVIVRRPDLIAWMAPSVDLVFFVGLALLLATLGRVLPRLASLPAAVFVFALFATWSQLFAHTTLHNCAILMLSAGVATAAARAAGRRVDRVVSLATRALAPTLLAVVAVSGAVMLWYGDWSHRVEAARSPESARNVLLIVLDTMRADHLGFHGYRRDTTPHLDGLAARGVVFEDAIATAPWTLPTHVSLFTGRYPFETTADRFRPLPGWHPTVAEYLSAHGYACAGFVGNVGYCSRAWGIDRGFEHYEDHRASPDVMVLGSPLGIGAVTAVMPQLMLQLIRNSAEHVTDRFLGWLDQRGKRPFFAFLNYFDTHGLYLCPEPFQSHFGEPAEHLADLYGRKVWSEAQRQGFLDAYDGCVRYMDHHIGRLLGELSRRGLLDDTVIVVTGDHGEQFGEHGLWEHANSLYLPLLHVPLLIKAPGLEPSRVPRTVSLSDVTATLIELSGVAGDHPFPGRSLAPLWRHPGADFSGSPVWSSFDGGASLIADGMHYIASPTRQELYDIHADRAELRDLMNTDAGKAFAQRAQQLSHRFLNERAATLPATGTGGR